MPKESESLNKNKKNSTEVIVYPQSTQVEEILISDEELIECDVQSYESRLDGKLKDLDLYEDGMTIQQKEELLAAVVASWETAEKEKTRRQFFQDYINASGAFCSDGVQELSSLLPSCLDVTLSVDTSNVSCYSEDSGTNSTKSFDDFAVHSSENDSPVEACKNENVCMKACELDSCSSREVKAKGQSPRRGKLRRGRISSKQSVGVDSSVSTDKKFIGELAGKKSEKHALETTMSSWKPCLSPKDTPLTYSKRPWPDKADLPHTYSEQECSLKIVKEFDFARRENKQLWQSTLIYDKPYHLSRRIHFAKRSNKPDKYDITVGVQENKADDPANTEREPFSRTSGDAFRCVKSHRGRLQPTQSNCEATRCGARKPVDIVFSEEARPSQCSDLFSEVEVILDEKCPHFNNLKPGLSGDVSFASKANGLDKHPENPRPPSFKPSCHSFQQTNHIDKSSYVGSDSSDTSSVIDVETIGDDEVQEFILKRKMLQDVLRVDKEESAKQSKRFRSGTS